MEAGSKPAAQWRIGTEHEKFGWLTDTPPAAALCGRPLDLGIVRGVAGPLRLDPGARGPEWIGLSRGAPISAWSRAASSSCRGRLRDAARNGCRDAHSIWPRWPNRRAAGHPLHGDRRGHPNGGTTRCRSCPRGRYRLMTEYMGRVGTQGHADDYRTCTLQVTLDYASEADMVRKLRVRAGAAAVATALFASSTLLRRSAQWLQVVALAHLARARRQPDGHAALRLRRGHGLSPRYGRLGARRAMYFVYPRRRYVNALGQAFARSSRANWPPCPAEAHAQRLGRPQRQRYSPRRG